MDTARLAAATMAAAIIGTQLVTAQPAVAALPGLQVVSSVTVGNSTSPKAVTATCTAPRVLIGGGVFVDEDGAPGQVVVDRLYPTSNAFWVRAHEVQGGTKANWWLRAFAVCAFPESVPGYTRVAVHSPAGSANATSTATCPAGKFTLTAGAKIEGGNGQVMLDALLPSRTSVTANAVEDFDGTDATWSLDTYAVCANDLPGLYVVSTMAMSDSADKAVTSVCNFGAVPLSNGWDIESRSPGRVHVDIAMPTSTGSLVSAREIGPDVTTMWSLATRTVCAFP
ncbi:MAG TPA: hypothetical protein DGG94_20610 [Micromonosporaceae bacterium]|nr:hypothetical protein [Micromonosporaceae bacterium]